MNENQIKELLKRKSLSITNSRIKIIKCLSDDTHFHTVKEIEEHVGDLNTKSIYNNIKKLIDEGIIDSYSFSGTSKFALSDSVLGQDEIHVISKDNDVHHHSISNETLKRIRENVESHGHKVKKVKVFVEIE